MKEIFESWIIEYKKTITRPDKYSSTITTISNHLKRKNLIEIDLFSILQAEEIIKIKGLYFSFDEYYLKNKKGNHMYSRSLDLYIEFLDTSALVPNNTIPQTIQTIVNNQNLTSTEKEAIILSRRGQGKFRDSLIELWGKCSISGYSDHRILVASHIKPWKDSNNFERTDKYNGLLLLPTFDKLFDLGLITFSLEGRIKISEQLQESRILSISSDTKINIYKEHLKYLDFHNNMRFKN